MMSVVWNIIFRSDLHTYSLLPLDSFSTSQLSYTNAYPQPPYQKKVFLSLSLSLARSICVNSCAASKTKQQQGKTVTIMPTFLISNRVDGLCFANSFPHSMKTKDDTNMILHLCLLCTHDPP